MAASTWIWIGNSNDPQLSSNWSLSAGPGNGKDRPQSGDTAVIPGGTPQQPLVSDSQFTSIVLNLTGSGGVTFDNDTSSLTNSSIDASSLIAATGTQTTLSLEGPFANYGTIAVTGTNDSLAINISAGSAAAGTLANYGQIAVNGGSLVISGGTLADSGALTVTDGSAVLTTALTGQNNFFVQQDGSLELNQTAATGAYTQVTFANDGSPKLLKLDNPGDFQGSISGVGSGATIDLGIVNVTTVEFDSQGDLIAIGSGGGTVFATALQGMSNGGTAISIPMSGTGGIAGDFLLTEGGGHDTTLTVLPPTTWLWAQGASGSGDNPADWSVYAGPGNSWNLPQNNDSAINAGGTLNFGSDAQLTGNTIYLGGTLGSPAVLIMTGGSSASISSPTIDDHSAITSAVPGASGAETTVIDAFGYLVNDGTIAADGPAGSSFTIAIAGTTMNGTAVPGVFINDNQIVVDAGNSMTITVGGTSALYNASEILVNGGSLLLTAASNALVGGYAPGTGAVVIDGGGTAEINIGYSSTVSGAVPVYAFADATPGNTLKIDNVGSFGGQILGFGAGDTIDLGTSLAVAQIVLSGSSGIMALENSGGTILASLQLASGNFGATAASTATIAVSGTSAGVFNVITGADGDTQLITNVAVDSSTNTSGTWQSASVWAGGNVPGALDTALLGAGGGSPFVVTTGSSSVTTGQLSVASDDATLQISSNTTVSLYPIQQFAGSVEVESGNTLSASALQMSGGRLQIDAGGMVDLYGHPVDGASPNYNIVAAKNGTISVSNTGTAAIGMGSGTLLISGGTLNAGTSQASGDGGRINIGYEGSGTPAVVTVQNSGASAGVVTDTYAIVASDPTSFGVLTLNGNASWTDQTDPHDTSNTRGYMVVGYNGQANNTGTATPAYSGAGTLTVENGATLTDQSYAEIGANTDSAGSVTVSNAVWNIGTANGGFLDVGLGGTGALLVTNAATVALGGVGTLVSNGTSSTVSGINIGGSAGGSGIVTVSGAGALVTDRASIQVGQAGTGDLQVLNGGTIQLNGTAGINVATSATAFGVLLVSGNDYNTGAAAELVFSSTSKGMTVGALGNGALDVESGGTIVMNGTGGLGVAGSLNATGLVTVNGPNAIITEGASAAGMGIGQASGAHGTVVVENGGSIILNGLGTSAGVGVGLSAGAVGMVIVSGNGALLADDAANSSINVGAAGQGIMQVNTGGIVTVAGNGLSIASSSSGSGTLDIFGGAMTLTGTAGGFNVGLNGSGTLVVADGGALTITGASTGFGIGVGGGASGNVNINNGTLTTNGFFSVGNTNATGTLTIGSGGTLINQNPTISAVISAAGTGHAVALVQGGTWSLAGGMTIGNGGTGSVDISSGGLVTASASGFINIGNFSGGNGTLTVENNGTLIGGSLQVANTGTGTASGYVSVGPGGTIEVGQFFENAGGSVVVGGGIGPALLAVNGGGFTVGQNNGTASLTINNAGTVNQTGTFTLSIGGSTGSSGTVTVNGGTLLAPALGVGGFGATGLLTVNAGGLVVMNGGNSSFDTVGGGTGGSGTLFVSGGTVIQSGSGFQIGGGSATAALVVANGGQVTTTNTNSFGFAGQIGASGTGVASGLVSGGTWTVNGQLGIGEGNTGSLDINTAGLVNAGTNQVQIGGGGGSNGTITVESGGTLEGGALSIANVFGTGSATGVLSVGAGGTVIISGGTLNSTIGSGFNPGISGNGVLLINGGTLSETGMGFSVGGSNVSGTLTLQNGGLLTTTATNNGTFYGSAGDISANGIGVAIATVSNATWNANGALTVGDSGAGSLIINAGGLVNASSVNVGDLSGGAGTVTVQGGGSLSAGQLNVANTFIGSSTGLVAITGATASATGVQVYGGGTITVGGAGAPSVFASSGFVTIGQSGTGAALTINQNGTFAIANTSDMEIAFNTASSGTVTVNGGLLQSRGVSFGGGSGTLVVQNGGVFDNTGNSISVGGGTGASANVAVQNGTILDNGDYFGIGSFGGTSTVTVGGGGTIISQGSLEFIDINAIGSGVASATVSAGSWTSDGSLIVGDSGVGSLDINSNGLVNAGTNAVIIGNQSGGDGAISLESGGTLIAGALNIGVAGVIGSGGTTVGGASGLVGSSIGAGAEPPPFGSLQVGAGATVTVSGSIGIGGYGTLALLGGTIDPTSIAIGGGRDGGFGLLSASQAIDNLGTLYASGGTLVVNAPLVTSGTVGGSGVLEVDSGANLVVNGAVDSSQSVNFAGPGTLTLGDISQFLPSDINGFAAGDTIVVTGVTSLNQSFNPGTDQLILIDQVGNHYTLQFTGSLTAASFTNATFPPPAPAQTASWIQDLAGDFDDPTKWSGGIVPNAATGATIDFADNPLMIHDAGVDTVASLANAGGDFLMSGGILTAGTLTNAALMSWTGGSLVLNVGTSGAADFLNAAGATLSIAGNGQRLSGAGSGSVVLSNAGSIVAAGAPGTANIDTLFSNTGQLTVTQGTLSLNGGGSSSGYNIAVGAGGVLQFGTTAGGNSNSFAITGGFFAPGNAAISGGTLDVSAASAAVFADTLAIGSGKLATGTLSAAAQGTFTQSGGTLSSSGTFTVYGAAALSGGLQTGGGTTDLLGTTLIDGPVAVDGTSTLLNQSRLNWSSGNIMLGGGDPTTAIHGGTLANAAGSLLYITADGTITAPGAAALSNAGAMVVYAGAGSTEIDAALSGSGVIQLQSGTLDLAGGGSANASNLFAGQAAVLQFGTATGGVGHTFSLSGVYTAPNTVVNGGTLDLSGASTVVFPTLLRLQSGGLHLGGQQAADQDTFSQTGGTLSGSGTLTVYGIASLMGGVETGSGTTQLFGVSGIGGGLALDGGHILATAAWLNWSNGNIALGSGDPGAVTQTGTLSVQGSGVLYATADGRISGSGVVDNAGVLAVLGGSGTTNIDVGLFNTGVVQVQSGTLSLNGGGSSNGGNLFVAPDAVLQFGSAASGVFAITGGAYTVGSTVVQGGTLDVSAAGGAGFGTSLTLAGGMVQLGTLTASSGVLVQSGGTLASNAFFFVGGAATLSGGVETGTGVTVLTTASSVSNLSLDGGHELSNGSMLLWTGGTIALGSGDTNTSNHTATLGNSGTLVIAGTGTIAGAGGLVANSGLIEQVGGLGTTAIAASVSNSGTIAVSSGTLAFDAGVNGGGTFLLSGTATLDFVSGVGGGGGMTFVAPGGTLETQGLGTFGAVVSGFGTGDAFDLTAVSSATATRSFNAGTLTVTDGTNSAAIVLNGTYSTASFVLGADGHGGTRVTFS